MKFDKRTFRQATLLWMALSSSIALSSQSASNNSVPQFTPSFTPLAALKQGHAVLQLGGYWSIQGSAQHIDIQNLIGDAFTVSHQHGSNGLVGLGYFIEGQEKERFKMIYGINAFYLAKAVVKGSVTQENLFTNLSYQYNITHYPVYVVSKAFIDTLSPKYAFTLDVGIGPNFMMANGFKESSLDGITLADNIFSSRTTTTFSAMVGAGIRFNQVFGKAPLECGYRFFYLGQGHFNKQTNQVINTLNTGPAYANALMCSMTL